MTDLLTTEPSRVTARRAQTRDRLMAAAISIFAARGIIGASVEEICEAAGFTRGAFYSNFADKDALVLALIQADIAGQYAAAEQAIAAMKSAPGERSPEELVSYALTEFEAVGRSGRDAVLAQQELLLYAARQPSLRDPYLVFADECVRQFTALIADAMTVQQAGVHRAVRRRDRTADRRPQPHAPAVAVHRHPRRPDPARPAHGDHPPGVAARDRASRARPCRTASSTRSSSRRVAADARAATDRGRHTKGMHILVVDDDQAVRDSLKRSLEYNAYEVSTAEDGVQALARLAAVRPDAVIMDVMMPRLDGLETTRMLRAAGNDVPILVLTARDAVGDRVDGLDAGGDDYLAKPFALDELLARLRALVRRAGTVADSADPSAHNLSFSDLVLNTQTREVLRGSRSINLTRTEFALLEAFMRHPRRVLERSWLLNEVWGFDFPTTANSLEVYIGYLRRKTEASDELAADPHRPRRRLRAARDPAVIHATPSPWCPDH